MVERNDVESHDEVAPEPLGAVNNGLLGRIRETVGGFFAKPSSFSLTREGWVLVVFSLGLGLAATNSGLNLLYLVFSLMMAFLVVSGHVAVRTLKRIQIQRSVPRYVVAGEPTDIVVTLHNGKRLFGSYGLRISDYMEDKTVAGCCYFLHVRAKGRATASYACRFNRRGLYRFDHLALATTYPFGFVQRSAARTAKREILVYPQILPLVQLGLGALPDLGERESRRKGEGASLYGLREQLPSEGSRWVHWKKTAQTDKLMRREFEAEEKKAVSLVLDNALRSSDNPEAVEAFERAVVLAASYAHHYLMAEHQVELVTRSGRIPYNTGPDQRHRILRALALIKPVDEGKAGALRISAGGADAIVIVFRCDGQGASMTHYNGSEVYTVLPESSRPVAARKFPSRQGALV